MKHIIYFILLTCAIPALGQINLSHNGIRVGDELVKQQVEYKDPGRDGENVIWDFGKLKSINDEYALTYTEPYLIDNSIYVLGKDTILAENISKSNIIIGNEHNTMYYYLQKDDKLLLLGHENPTTLLKYTEPTVAMLYPLNYMNEFKGTYESEGLYSSRIDFHTKGKTQTKADAYGMMILPSGDTLKHVMRTKTIESISETINSTGDKEDKDVNTIVESYKWYSKGYRYPIFETIRSTSGIDTANVNISDIDIFSTAFFFPPQEHLYLDYDKENLAVLDSLWNIDSGKKEPDMPNSEDWNPEMSFTYNFYPNPVIDILTVEYYLEKSSDLNISLYNTQGQLIKTINKPKQISGMYTEQIDFSSFANGAYIISISTGYKVHSNKIIKK